MTKVVLNFLNLTLMYLISLSRVRSSSHHCILNIYTAYGTLPASSRELMGLIHYLMLKSSAWLFVILPPEYSDWIRVIISIPLKSDVICGNYRCSWASFWPL